MEDGVIMAELPAIDVKHLTVEYKTGWKKRCLAVSDVSFSVKQGEIVGFIGPNGAGKTSVIKALLGFTPTPLGNCYILGIPCSDPKSREKVGYMPEISYYPKYLTLSEFLHACAAVSGVPARVRRNVVMTVARRVDMESHLRSRLSSFSKGMLQQAGCAQALIHNPDILILDEPMSGLDPVARMRMRQLLADLRSEGKTILFSSHELSEIELVADRIILMNKGRLLYEGVVAQIVQADINLEKAFLRLLGEELPCAA